MGRDAGLVSGFFELRSVRGQAELQAVERRFADFQYWPNGLFPDFPECGPFAGDQIFPFDRFERSQLHYAFSGDHEWIACLVLVYEMFKKTLAYPCHPNPAINF